MKDIEKKKESGISLVDENATNIPTEEVTLIGRELYLLYRGLMKYADYPSKDFSLFVYRGIGSIKDIAMRILELTSPLDEYYSLERELRLKYFSTDAVEFKMGIGELEGCRENDHVSLFLESVSKLREQYGEYLSRELETRKEVEDILGREYKIGIGRVSFSLLPKEFTAQDIEVFNPLIVYE